MAQTALQVLGDFELLREIGRGGMGIVYESRQISLNRKVALKVLGPGLGLTARAIERFRHEAEAAGRLHHTHIVPVYATGDHDGIHYYAMELIEGPSLDRVLRQLRGSGESETPVELAQTADYAPCDEVAQQAGLSASSLNSGAGYFDTVARMAAGVADALDYAHRNGVIHRDVKPSNLLLSPDARLSLNDFGLARMLEQPGMTMTGEFVGTPLYMAPEQIAAGRVPIDHRADTYSLGATLYELLVLRPPFEGGRRDQVIAQVLYKEPVAPRRVSPKVPVDLETICLKAMEKDPDRRYQTAGQMAEDLRRYVNRFAISARRAGPLTRSWKWAKRNPALAAAALMVCLALAVAGFFAWRAHESEQQRQVELDAERRQAALERGMAAALAADLPAAEKAVADAEMLGASTGETRLLRGMIDVYSGRAPDAVVHLEQAVRLLPESVTARALLAVACARASDYPGYHRNLAEAEALKPQTSHDKLFLGSAIGMLRPTEGLLLMDQAVAERSSGISHMLRADIRVNLAEFTGSVKEAESAIVDSELAKRLLPGNPYPMTEAALARFITAILYRKAGRMDKWKEHLDALERELDALAGFPDNYSVLQARYTIAMVRDGLDGKLNMIADIRKVRAPSLAPKLAHYEAYDHFCRGQDADAIQAAGKFPNDRLAGHVCFLAALCRKDGKADARQAVELITGPDCAPALRLEAAPLLFAVADSGQVGNIVRAVRIAGDPARALNYSPADHAAILDFLEGRLSEDDLLGKPAANGTERSRRHYVIGWKRLAAGDRAGAQAAFQKTVDNTMTFGAMSWRMARAMLIRMKDSEWPQALAKR